MNRENIKFLEGSQAIAQTILNIEPQVVSAYPITPQTHIVEALAKFKAEKKAKYSYILAESEFAAISILIGASATGARTYTATSSQGLLLMTEALYNASGLRLAIVMTIANRALGAPISIWNDHSDVMAIRDSGWGLLFAENHQEAVDLHILAYKLAENFNIPIAVNVDGYILTHSYENLYMPSKAKVKEFLGTYKAKEGTYLSPKDPITLGALFSPKYYHQEKKQLYSDFKLLNTKIRDYYKEWKKLAPSPSIIKPSYDDGLVEYTGPRNAKNIIVAMGSMAGTIKETLKTEKNTALLKLRSFRPFPESSILKLTKNARNIAILEKVSPAGSHTPLFLDISTILPKNIITSSHIVGLGGKNISEKIIKEIIKSIKQKQVKFW